MVLEPKAYLRKIPELAQPLTCLKGIGPKKASLLTHKGLYTILDLLYFRPIRYEDRTRIASIKDAPEGAFAFVTGRVINGREARFPRSHKRLFRIWIEEKGHSLELLWFHYRKPQLAGLARPGNQLLAFGAIQRNRGKRQMVHPEVRVLTGSKDELDRLLGFYPVYSGMPSVMFEITGGAGDGICMGKNINSAVTVTVSGKNNNIARHKLGNAHGTRIVS